MPVPSLPDDAWRAWSPGELADRLRGVARPWCIVGGWALDLWLGEQTRVHDDLEFAVLRDDVAHFMAALPDLAWHAVAAGTVVHLPAGHAPPTDAGQFWGMSVADACWRVDLMVEPGTAAAWVCKRDAALVRPRGEMVCHTADGIPYLHPVAVLLFKAKYRRDKDEADFARALPRLSASERAWLRAWLDAVHPGHAWRDRLAPAA